MCMVKSEKGESNKTSKVLERCGRVTERLSMGDFYVLSLDGLKSGYVEVT